MNLEIFNNWFNKEKKDEFIQKFINELSEATEEKQESILDEILEESNGTNELRDKMLVERVKILEDYAKQNENKGDMYYVYEKSPKDNETYLMTILGTKKYNEVFEIRKNEMPLNSGIDSVLRKEDKMFTLDEEATKFAMNKMKERFIELANEESKLTNRVEGHIYEFVERTADSAWLIDTNQPQEENQESYDVFEEKEFPYELLTEAKEGDLFQYINGNYKIIK